MFGLYIIQMLIQCRQMKVLISFTSFHWVTYSKILAKAAIFVRLCLHFRVIVDLFLIQSPESVENFWSKLTNFDSF